MSLLKDLKKELPVQSRKVIARFLSSPCCGEDKESGNNLKQKKEE